MGMDNHARGAELDGVVTMKTFELTMTLKNNLIKSRRTEMGLSPKEASAKSGICYPTWCEYEGMRRSPIGADGGWKPSALAMARFFGVSVEELFPDCVISVKMPSLKTEIDGNELRSLSSMRNSPDRLLMPDQEIETREKLGLVALEMSELHPKARRILELRFGLNGEREHTFDEIGELCGFCRERARQLVQNAVKEVRQRAYRLLGKDGVEEMFGAKLEHDGRYAPGGM